MRHINKHTCSRAVDFEVENGIITRCQFIGGCPEIPRALLPSSPAVL